MLKPKLHGQMVFLTLFIIDSDLLTLGNDSVDRSKLLLGYSLLTKKELIMTYSTLKFRLWQKIYEVRNCELGKIFLHD